MALGLAAVVEVHGAVAAGWGEVVDAFIVGFDGFDEIGASCCIYVEGRPVVDIWAGVADRRSGQPWMADTAAVIFSATKGATAICANLLVQRGQLDLDTKVSDYWPEFRGGGKEAIPVRWLLTHQAGLPGIDAELRQEDVLAWEPVIHALEAQDLVPTPVRRRNSATRGLPAQGIHDSPYGRIESSRNVDGNNFTLCVHVPPGTVAEVELPDGTRLEARRVLERSAARSSTLNEATPSLGTFTTA
jgi:hypothetical protein